MKKRETASELMARLNADPEFVAKAARREEARIVRETALLSAQEPLLDELRAVGVVVESVWDLVNTSMPYPGALSVLLDHFQRPYPASVREGIARALAVPAARFARNELVKLYQHESDPIVKEGLAVAVAATTADEDLEDLIALVRDDTCGQSRLLLLSALERSSDPRALSTLVALRSNPVFAKEIPYILRRLGRKSKVSRLRQP